MFCPLDEADPQFGVFVKLNPRTLRLLQEWPTALPVEGCSPTEAAVASDVRNGRAGLVAQLRYFV